MTNKNKNATIKKGQGVICRSSRLLTFINVHLRNYILLVTNYWISTFVDGRREEIYNSFHHPEETTSITSYVPEPWVRANPTVT